MCSEDQHAVVLRYTATTPHTRATTELCTSRTLERSLLHAQRHVALQRADAHLFLRANCFKQHVCIRAQRSHEIASDDQLLRCVFCARWLVPCPDLLVCLDHTKRRICYAVTVYSASFGIAPQWRKHLAIPVWSDNTHERSCGS